MFAGMIIMILAFLVAACLQAGIQVEYYEFYIKILFENFRHKQDRFQFVLIQMYLMDIVVELISVILIKHFNLDK